MIIRNTSKTIIGIGDKLLMQGGEVRITKMLPGLLGLERTGEIQIIREPNDEVETDTKMDVNTLTFVSTTVDEAPIEADVVATVPDAVTETIKPVRKPRTKKEDE